MKAHLALVTTARPGYLIAGVPVGARGDQLERSTCAQPFGWRTCPSATATSWPSTTSASKCGQARPALLGANGAGKTTTIAMILGLLAASAGRITVLGEEVPRHRAQVLGRMNFSSPYVDLPAR